MQTQRLPPNQTLFSGSSLDFPAFGRQPNELPTSFIRRFELMPEDVAPRFMEDIRTIISDLFVNSSLFRCLLTQPSSDSKRWKIYPFGLDGSNTFIPGHLTAESGIIDAASGGALYLGLIDTYVMQSESNQSVPAASVTNVEPIRLLMDGVVSVLTAPLVLPYRGRIDQGLDRGVEAWLTDTIMWQAQVPIMKRLSARLVSQSDTDAIKALTLQASTSRRFARVEDEYLVRWLDELLDDVGLT